LVERVYDVPGVNPALAAYIVANTGGANSPYTDLKASMPIAPDAIQSAPAGSGFVHQIAQVNGQNFSLPVADCPAASCTNDNPIAWFSDDPQDQATLAAYKAALQKQDAKAAVSGGLAIGAIVAAPVTLTGVVVTGAVVGASNSAAGQYIDTGNVNASTMFAGAVQGAAFAEVGYVAGAAVSSVAGVMGGARIVGSEVASSTSTVSSAQQLAMDAGAGPLTAEAAGQYGVDKAGAALSPAETAASWQGSLLYPGVDRYRNIVLQPDMYLVGSTPGQGSYYTTMSGMARTEMDVILYNQGLQVAPNLTNPSRDVVRDGLTIYRVTSPTAAAFGRALANPQLGSGGLPQVFVPADDNGLFPTLQKIDFIPFVNKIPGVKP
jgi:hypothetical protein